MKAFLLRLLAVIGGFFLFMMLCGGLYAWYWYAHLSSPEATPKDMVLALDFTTPVVETTPDFSFSLQNIMYENEQPTPLIYIIRALENAKDDPKVKGVVANFGSRTLSFVQVQEIAKALQDFRQSGKFSYAYAANYGNFTAHGTNYLLASAFENIWLQPVGTIGLSNLGVESPFAKSALAKIGIVGDFMQREEYKSVMENITRDAYSPPVKENLTSLIGNMNDQLIRTLAASRKIDVAQAQTLFSNGPYTSNEALKNKLVTQLAYQDQFSDIVDEKAGKEAAVVSPSTYLAYFLNDHPAEQAKAEIALIVADGMIVDEAPKGPERLAMQGEIINTDSIVQAFDDAAKDKDVKAILFRVNSPGGSPSASESIRRALDKAKESKKPVYVSMGRVAASGGYWIAMDADKIIADPATLTGSIGVVAGKFVLGELFDKLGLTWDTISTGDNATMWSVRKPFSDKGRERMNAMLDDTYKTFTDSVAAARKIPPEKIPDIAKGRVYTGEQALKAGLVDELGGLNETIAALKTTLNLKADDRVVIAQFPPPETPVSLLMQILENLPFTGANFNGLLPFLHDAQAALLPFLQTLLLQTGTLHASLPVAFQGLGL